MAIIIIIIIIRSGTENKELTTTEPPTTHKTMVKKATAVIAANQLAVGTTTANGQVATSGRHVTNMEVPSTPECHHRPHRCCNFLCQQGKHAAGGTSPLWIPAGRPGHK